MTTHPNQTCHSNDVIMSAMVSQITSLTIVYSTVYSGADQRKHQSSASLAFVRGINRWLMNSLHKGPVTRKMFPFHDAIMHNIWRYQIKSNRRCYSPHNIHIVYTWCTYTNNCLMWRASREARLIMLLSLSVFNQYTLRFRDFCRNSDQLGVRCPAKRDKL